MEPNGAVFTQIRHNFETAHRLPFLGGKCTNWHGHSWKCEVTIYNTAFDTGMNENGISCEFGLVKDVIRGWIDSELDHGVMIGAQDKMLEHFIADGGKLFVFGEDGEWDKMPWPTVEAVAAMLADKLQGQLNMINGRLYVDAVRIHETDVNTAEWFANKVHYRATDE